MFSEHTNSDGNVNSPLQDFLSPSPISTEEDLFTSIVKVLGGNGILILRRLFYLSDKGGSRSCIVSQKALSRRAKCSENTAKAKLATMIGCDIIVRDNRKPSWYKDNEGTRKPRWRSNRYTFTEFGLRFIQQWRWGSKAKFLNRETSTLCISDIWERGSTQRESCKKVQQIRELQDRILEKAALESEQQYIASKLATLLIKKEERKKKGGSFSHGLEGETQDLRRRETRTTPRERGENQIRGRTTDSSGTGRDEEEDPRTGGTTRSPIDRIVNNLLKSDSYTYALLPRKVENALNRGVDGNVVLEKLNEIAEFKIKYWSSEFDRIVTAYTAGKKGEPFSHEENRNKNTEVTVGDRRRNGTADRQSGHRTAHRGRTDTRQSRNEQNDLATNQNGVDYEQNGKITENESGRTSGYPTERGVPDTRSRIGGGGGIERTHETKSRRNASADYPVPTLVGGQRRRLTKESLRLDATAIMGCNKMLKGLGIFVNTLFQDEYSPDVIYRVLISIQNTTSKEWWRLGVFLARKFQCEEKNAQISQEKIKRETAERAKRWDSWDVEKSRGPEKFDFMVQMEKCRTKYREERRCQS